MSSDNSVLGGHEVMSIHELVEVTRYILRSESDYFDFFVYEVDQDDEGDDDNEGKKKLPSFTPFPSILFYFTLHPPPFRPLI